MLQSGPSFEKRCGDYVISDDPGRFDADALHDFLEGEGYWARGRSRESTAVAVANSVVLGAYGPDGAMVGGARIVTDRATFGWLTDLYVLDGHRGRGLGGALAAAACEHPAVAGIKRLLLVTADAHELYRPLGFAALDEPGQWLELQPARGASPSRLETAAGLARPGGAGNGGAGNGGEAGDTGAAHGIPAASTANGTASGNDAEPMPHTAWQGVGLPDPRTARVSQITERLLEIVEAEEPLTSDRAFRLYLKGSGASKLTQRARLPMEQALGRLTLRGQVLADELDNAGSPQQVLRMRGTPPVVVRELGERSLYEVPLNEIAELMRRLRQKLMGRSGRSGPSTHAVAEVIKQASQRRASPDRLKRAVLDAYGLTRLTQAAEQYLSTALTLLESTESEDPT